MGLVEFYRDSAKDHAGRTLEDVLGFDNGQLEAIHDYIQWLFPVPEPSRFQPYIPVLTAKDIETFRNDPAMQENLRRSFEKMLSFYGFKDTGSKVELTADFNERARVWLTPGNHNFMRITRILRSLTLLGLEAEAQRFFGALDEGHKHPVVGKIMGNSHAYWKQQVPGLS